MCDVVVVVVVVVAAEFAFCACAMQSKTRSAHFLTAGRGVEHQEMEADQSQSPAGARSAPLLSSLIQTRSVELVLAPIASQVSS